MVVVTQLVTSDQFPTLAAANIHDRRLLYLADENISNVDRSALLTRLTIDLHGNDLWIADWGELFNDAGDLPPPVSGSKGEQDPHGGKDQPRFDHVADIDLTGAKCHRIGRR